MTQPPGLFLGFFMCPKKGKRPDTPPRLLCLSLDIFAKLGEDKCLLERTITLLEWGRKAAPKTTH